MQTLDEISANYDAGQIKAWEDGASRFADFWKNMEVPFSSDLFGGNYPMEIASIQGLFLGERAATFGNEYAHKNEELLGKHGFESCGKMIFSREKAKKVMQKYEEEFDQYRNVDELMEKIRTTDVHQMHVEIGLLLGFPLGSAHGWSISTGYQDLQREFFENCGSNELRKEYNKECSLRGSEGIIDVFEKYRKLAPEEKKIIRYHLSYFSGGAAGMAWANFREDMREVEEKQKRYEDAFKISKIKHVSHIGSLGVKLLTASKIGSILTGGKEREKRG